MSGVTGAAAVVGAGAAVAGTASSISSAKKQDKAAQAAAAKAGGVAPTPFQFFGPGGASAGFQSVSGANTAASGAPVYNPATGTWGYPQAAPTAPAGPTTGGTPSGPQASAFNAAAAAGPTGATPTAAPGPTSWSQVIPEPTNNPAWTSRSDKSLTWEQYLAGQLGKGGAMNGAGQPRIAGPSGINASLMNYVNQASNTAGFPGFVPGQALPPAQAQAQANAATSVGSSLGDLEQPRQGLVGLAQQGINSAAGPLQLPQGVQQADAIRAMFSDPAILQAAGLRNNTFGQAAELSSGSFGQSILDKLRAQAAPFENRQKNSLFDSLYAKGQLGSSGGGLQTEAFARGLGQADNERQTQALGLQDQLLQNAFQRFGQTSGLASDLTQQGITNQAAFAQLPRDLRNSDLGFATNALQAQGGLNAQGLNNFQAALNAMIAQGNIQNGAAGNVVGAASNPNIGAGGAAIGSALTGLAARFPSLASAFGPAAQQPPVNPVYDPAQGVCYLAQEVLGKTNPEWVQFFHWKEQKASPEFRAWYNANAKELAGSVRNQPELKSYLATAMREAIAHG